MPAWTPCLYPFAQFGLLDDGFGMGNFLSKGIFKVFVHELHTRQIILLNFRAKLPIETSA